MTGNTKPKARQSQLVTTYGVGSLFPAGDQSFIICGLDEWDERYCPIIEEPRLAASLGVQEFRAPSSGLKKGDVPAVRFPEYHYCPNCQRLDRFWKFDAQTMQCPDCARDLTPSRFVVCCENGHIEDFPYFEWVHRGSQLATSDHHMMRIKAEGASSSLADIVVSCSCGVVPHNLDGSFSRGALREIKSCAGHRPWLPDSPDEGCTKMLRTLQRGSSNVWFSVTRSTISIPPWSGAGARFVDRYWTVLDALPHDELTKYLSKMLIHEPGLTTQAVLDAIRLRRGITGQQGMSEAQLRVGEYHALVDGNDEGPRDAFRCREVDVAEKLEPLVAQVSRADRLREVRALHGFTRVSPTPTMTTAPSLSSLSSEHLHWLPATEVLGEGVFVRLDEDELKRWEATDWARSRQDLLATSTKKHETASGGSGSQAPSARFLALHTLAHLLVKEFSLDAGYPIASLRERVYADPGQSGILIYTASSDSAGSLGGLAALSEPDRFAEVVTTAIEKARWCSNDPVCTESVPSGVDGANLSACHACLLLPETSCENGNVHLDRACVIGEGTDTGLLANLIGGW